MIQQKCRTLPLESCFCLVIWPLCYLTQCDPCFLDATPRRQQQQHKKTPEATTQRGHGVLEVGQEGGRGRQLGHGPHRSRGQGSRRVQRALPGAQHGKETDVRTYLSTRCSFASFLWQDRDTSDAAWNTYEAIRQNYTLEVCSVPIYLLASAVKVQSNKQYNFRAIKCIGCLAHCMWLVTT